MTDTSTNADANSTEDFNAFSFERKVVELVEEVRLRRNLEVESEKTLKSVMDENYQEELARDEQMRRHNREKENFEQQLDLLKRKLEDKVCVSDEDKAKQQIMTKTYSHEVRMLKEELRVSKSEKLNLQKKIQELEGKLKLHDNFQESILSQVSEVRKMMKTIFEECKELATKQKKVLENVASAKNLFKKYDLCNQHLQQCVEIIGKKSEALKRKLIKSQSEATLLKQSMPAKKDNTNYIQEIEKLQDKVLNLENLLSAAQKDKKDTLNNFLGSNSLLHKIMDKYCEIQEREKQLIKEVERLQKELSDKQNELQKTQDEIKDMEEKASLKEKERIENERSTEMQTENALNQCCSCSKIMMKSSNDKITSTLASVLPKAIDKSFMDELTNDLVNLQQNAVLMQSEMSIDNGIHSFSLDQLFVNSANKKITLSQTLKRKLEIMDSGDKIELFSLKKRFTENTSESLIVVNNGVEDGVQNKMISYEMTDQPLCNSSVRAISMSPVSTSGDNEMLQFDEVSDRPLGNTLNLDISVSPLSQSTSGIEILISDEANERPLCNGFDSKNLPPIDIMLDQKYLTPEKFDKAIDNGEN